MNGNTKRSFTKGPVVPIVLGLSSIAFMGALFWWAFSAQREDVATARAFLTLIAAEDYASAQSLMTPDLINALPGPVLAHQFAELEAWVDLRFPSRNSSSGGGARTTEITGYGTTRSGCESGLTIRLIDGRVDAFNVTPICPRIGVDA